MIIFGLDPGIAIVGYGIIEAVGNRVRLIDYGVIETKAGIPLPDRLKSIDEELNKLIDLHNVDELAIEELFFNKNVKTVINVAQARGVEILSFIKKNILAYEYTPLGYLLNQMHLEEYKIFLNYLLTLHHLYTRDLNPINF